MTLTRSTSAVLLACTLVISPWRGVVGHPLLQAPMRVEVTSKAVSLSVGVTFKEIALVENPLPAADGGYDPAVLEKSARKHEAYLLAHIRMTTDGRVMAGRIVRRDAPTTFTTAEGTYYRYVMAFPLPSPAPETIAIIQDNLSGYAYEHLLPGATRVNGTQWDISYVVTGKEVNGHLLGPELLRRSGSLNIPTGIKNRMPEVRGWPNVSETVRTFLMAGIIHILTGWDHLLFVSALVLAIRTIWGLVKVVAAFTLAHTATLVLFVLHLVRLPAWIVEPVIAASIIYVALENLLMPSAPDSRRRLAVAFCFGLVHGCGFAGGLLTAMRGLPGTGVWIAVGAFSLGVEIGHQLVVLPLYGICTSARHRHEPEQPRLMLRLGSGFISACGAYYLCTSIHDQFFLR